MSDIMVDGDTDVAIVERVIMDPPRLWNVLLLNDDNTTMEFVVLVLMQIFHKSFEEAQDVMMSIHEHGRGIAGTYSHEVAATKRDETITVARTNDSPLVAIIEPKQ
jgi:ATP-dependent Clp protease adaptor protein ClpS